MIPPCFVCDSTGICCHREPELIPHLVRLCQHARPRPVHEPSTRPVIAEPRPVLPAQEPPADAPQPAPPRSLGQGRRMAAAGGESQGFQLEVTADDAYRNRGPQ